LFWFSCHRPTTPRFTLRHQFFQNLFAVFFCDLFSDPRKLSQNLNYTAMLVDSCAATGTSLTGGADVTGSATDRVREAIGAAGRLAAGRTEVSLEEDLPLEAEPLSLTTIGPDSWPANTATLTEKVGEVGSRTSPEIIAGTEMDSVIATVVGAKICTFEESGATVAATEAESVTVTTAATEAQCGTTAT
jgi:hypothetical protein